MTMTCCPSTLNELYLLRDQLRRRLADAWITRESTALIHELELAIRRNWSLIEEMEDRAPDG